MRLDLHPFDGLGDAVAWGRREIDQAAQQARERFATSLAGQSAIYNDKYWEACAVLASDSTPPGANPWIEEEARRSGSSLTEVAARVKARGDASRRAGPVIEAARVFGKDRLTAAGTVAQVVKVTRDVIAEIGRCVAG
jgi:cell pole-organizing protein PopZ